jgi:hypothetical protein
MPAKDAFSPLVLDEFFAAGDERFLDHLIRFHEPKKLAALADRWKRDSRPWARRALLAYLEQFPASPGHEAVVKRLFKHAEAQGDDELMARFAHAFDLQVRRRRATRWAWDLTLRQSTSVAHLVTPRDVLPKLKAPPRAGEPPWPASRLFSYHTRHYLRRRAWRYFRRMGHQRADRYPRAVAGMLRLYAEASLNSGEGLLDSRSLMHACFRGSDVLDFTPAHVNLRPGRSLAELVAAPAHAAVWRRRAAADVLLDLMATADARAMRAWAVQVFRGSHFDPPPSLPPERLLPLLDHADELVQQVGADLLERAVGLETLAFDDWLRLLQTRNLTALETVARVMRRHVTAERVTLAQAVDLACAAPIPVARLGFDLLRGKPVATPTDRQTIARLADAKAEAVAGELATWALGVLGPAGAYDVDLVVRFFDALLRPARQAAWAWLVADPRPGAYDDPALWSRLIETPYDDLRLHLVEDLKRRAALPGVAPDRLGPAVWAPVLLGIHRGGRAKLTALRQIGDAVARDPARAEPLLPVLAVAIRSVRLPEARHGLAAVVRAVEANPELAGAVSRHLPELDLGAPGILGTVACR